MSSTFTLDWVSFGAGTLVGAVGMVFLLLLYGISNR